MPYHSGTGAILVNGAVVNTSNPLPFEYGDSAAIDPVARLRISQGLTLFDYKQLYDKQPLLFDETIAGAATSVHSTTNSAVTMTVTGNGDSVVRQTFRRFNHQPGKGSNALFTTVLGTGATGVTKRVGHFSASNGLFFQQSGTTLSVGVRKGASDTIIARDDWNIDKLDGTGISGATLDVTKAQLLSIDFQWLGVGRIRFGIFIDGLVQYVHEIQNSNVSTSVFMSTPNLPIRYEISSTSGAATLTHICSAIISEGGQDDSGILRYFSTNGTHVDANAANTLYAVLGIRLKATHLDLVVKVENMTMISETNDDYEWVLVLDPTVAGTFTYGDETNSGLQTARGATANTVTVGTRLMGGFSKSTSDTRAQLNNPLYLGSTIAGTSQTMVLCVRPLGSNSDIQGSLVVRELL